MLSNTIRKHLDALSWSRWQHNFSSYRGRMSKDREVVGEGYYDEDLLKVLEKLLGRKQSHKRLYQEVLKACENPNFAKNRYTVATTMDNVEAFLSNERPYFMHNRFAKMGLRSVNEMVKKAAQGKEVLDPLSINDPDIIQKAFSNMKASMGFLFPGKKKIDDPELLISVAKELLAELPDETLPALAMYRVQLGNIADGNEVTPDKVKVKQRLVWCIDAATVLIEALYARPFIDNIMVNMPQYAGGKDSSEISRYVRHWNQFGYWLCIDYSKFDSTIPSWLIATAFDIVKSYFPEKDHTIINWLCKQFTHTKIWTPGGFVKKHKGIPSGSYFTQIIGTLCNLIMAQTYIWKECKGDIFEYRKNFLYHGNVPMMAMGDDNVIFSRKRIDLKSLSTYLKHNFGVDVSTDVAKVAFGTHQTDPHFLKRDWKIEGAWRNPLELFVNMVRAERKRTYDDYTPYHILYGYMLTYPGAFRGIISIFDVVEGMGGYDGLEAMEKVRLTDMPGSLKVIVMNNPDYWKKIKRSWAGHYGKPVYDTA